MIDVFGLIFFNGGKIKLSFHLANLYHCNNKYTEIYESGLLQLPKCSTIQ